jgi:glyoxylase-like metal-dependent hydrolase (beta-lactamase superfamily II)
MTVYRDKQLVIFQSALYQTNTTLFISDEFALLVDPNWTAKEIKYIEAYTHLHFQNKSIYLLFTHSDYDHIIGYKAFPGAKVIASSRFQSRPDKDRILNEIHQFDQQHYIDRPYPIEYPEVDIIVEQDSMQVEIKGEKFWFYDAPGHTDDGLFTIVESMGLFIAGDYLSDLEFPFIYYNSEAYINTLDKVNQILQKHPISMLVPGHGTYLKDENNKILERLERDRVYINQLRKCIESGTKFPLDEWLSKFPFPDGLREQHSKNEEHIKKEFQR